ncbi:MAG: F0F1 ATP synthase subunit B [Bacteroidales bacterium]|nr:F0F1 ATP synthase subunit B [Bacteroidales bacterium]MBK7173765.1 F0F1 ATP synthase subunit B [Bacteroidales bacterium]
MELVKVDIGLLFWMTLTFGTVLFILGKFAWKPIMKMLHEREESIEKALHAAEEAKKEMLKLKAGNEQLLLEAKEERDALMRDARKVKEAIIDEARLKANEEANRIIENARESIQFEKMAAINELKNQIASISIEIAEKLIGQELADKEKQNQLTEKLLKEVKIN